MTHRRRGLVLLAVALVGVLVAVCSPWSHRPALAGLLRRGATVGASSAGAHDRFVTVGLGDSVPSGYDCPGCTSFVTLVGQAAARAHHEQPRIVNRAVSGLRTRGLLTQLGTARLQSDLASANLVLVTIGANDLDPTDLVPACGDTPVAECRASQVRAVADNLSVILDRVRAGATTPGVRIVVTGYWNVGVDGQVGARAGQQALRASRDLTVALDDELAAVTRAHDATWVDLTPVFLGARGEKDPTPLLSQDGDHPSQAGHVAIARAVLTALGLPARVG